MPHHAPEDLFGPRPRLHPSCGAFTLLEMVVVVAVIGMLLAVAVPQLMPAIVFSRGEGAARHLAGFGRSAMAHASLLRENVTVKINLDKQEYWAERLIREDEEEFFVDKGQEGGGKAGGDFMDLMGSSGLRTSQSGAPQLSGDDPAAAEAEAALMMRRRLERYIRLQTEARAARLDKGSLFEDMGPMFEKKFDLDDTESHIVEIKDSLLMRTALPEGVKIEQVRVGSTEHRSGEVEIELSSLGLFEPVLFYVVNEDEDYFTVAWEPLTGTARFERGKVDPESLGEGSQ